MYFKIYALLSGPEECFAILISGFDDDEEQQKTFDDDIQAMLDVICDPRVMGFRYVSIYCKIVTVIQ